MDSDLQTLNERYAIPGHVSFHAGPGGLVMAVVNNAHAVAAMTLAGGHVMTFTPHGGQPLLWVSPNAAHTLGKAMRGGVPVCWPWFATQSPDPENLPLHGFVRTMLWSLAGTRALPDGSTEVRMVLRDTSETLAVWPHAFELELVAVFGPRLRLEWIARNPGSAPYQYTGALHPYYVVSDIRAITLRGLEETDYFDKTDGFHRKHQPGSLKINGLVDNIYLNTTCEVTIADPGLDRTIHIAKQGSRTTVVWNPDSMDAEMPDVGAGQHCCFVCAEAANADEDVVTVAPGGEGRLMMEIWSEKGVQS